MNMNSVIIELDKARAERLVELLKERGADDSNFMLKQVKAQLEGKCKRSMIEWNTDNLPPCHGWFMALRDYPDWDAKRIDSGYWNGKDFHFNGRIAHGCDIEAWANLPK